MSDRRSQGDPGTPLTPAGDDSAPLRLLIVDDEPQFRQALARRLGLRGLEVWAAASGAEALSIARERELDVALVDLKMPEMGGVEVQRALVELQPDLEVIILTGHGAGEPAPPTPGATPLQYIQKPCETQELMGTLSAGAQRSRRRRARRSEHPGSDSSTKGPATGERGTP